MSFINRNGDEYYAFQGKTKTGKPKYFASKKRSSDNGKRIDQLPAEFEFYENPANGIVAIRRRVSSEPKKGVMNRCFDLPIRDTDAGQLWNNKMLGIGP